MGGKGREGKKVNTPKGKKRGKEKEKGEGKGSGK